MWFQKRKMEALFVIALTLMIPLVYGPFLDHEFLFDDIAYTLDNPFVQQGFTSETLKWAFTDSARISWQPLTWLSLMLDAELHVVKPFGYHLTNLILHILSSLVLFFTFRRATDCFWPSALVTTLFAFHPVNVESVIWISQRKNVLSGLFWMLAMWAYVWYAGRPVLWRYLLISLFFVLGLMSKLTMTPFPIAMLLLDYWPLGRLRIRKRGEASPEVRTIFRVIQKNWLELILEKVPWLVLGAGVVCILVYFDPNKMMSETLHPIGLRLSNAVVSYVTYLGMLFWPVNLAIWYPFPGSVPFWRVLGALAILGLLTGTVWWWRDKRPYLLMGWLWYLGVLVPALGLIQNEIWPAQADHHLYLPALGIFVMVSFGLFHPAQDRYLYKLIAVSVSVVFLMVLPLTAWHQLGYWRNPLLLYEHTLKVTSNNYVIHDNLGWVLIQKGKLEEAIPHFLKALRINPGSFSSNLNGGLAYLRLGHPDKALPYLQEAVKIQSDSYEALGNLGVALVRLGRPHEAISCYQKALQLMPNLAGLHYNLGEALLEVGRQREAVISFQNALKVNPKYMAAREMLEILLLQQNKER